VPTLQDETRIEFASERRVKPPLLPPDPEQEIQRKRMLIALGVLLVALVAVVVKDWDFWFPGNTDADYATTSGKKRVAANAVPAPVSAPANTGREIIKKAKNEPAADVPFHATAERAALPPLQVEVVAGNQRKTVAVKNPAIHLDMSSGDTSASAEPPAVAAQPVVNVADRVQLSPQTTQSVSVSVPPNYPMLARQMKVQGAVILQALISREGSIQELQVLNGPGILATAAREAVKQWRFKPYYMNGQPVETQARITVNFTISTN
jgi:periplasmic protein TonB